MIIHVHRKYYCGGTDVVDLPCDWSDVELWCIKWETFYFKRKGKPDLEEVELDLNIMEAVDTKRPVQACILTEDGEELDDEN
jgi:hypothetical protein